MPLLCNLTVRRSHPLIPVIGRLLASVSMDIAKQDKGSVIYLDWDRRAALVIHLSVY